MSIAAAGVTSLEEQILRVLFEGSASFERCLEALFPFASPSAGAPQDVERMLYHLVSAGYAVRTPDARYAITPAGSCRLADLVE
jgi:hypothetical protein